MKTHARIGLAFALASAICMFAGCSEEKKKSHIEEVTGTIENIGTRSVVVRTFSQKHNKELKFDVIVDPETEILINGSIASIKDLKVGETAFGSVRVEEKGDDKKVITAVKVRVERAEVLRVPTAAGDEASKKKDDGQSEDDGETGTDEGDGGE